MRTIIKKQVFLGLLLLLLCQLCFAQFEEGKETVILTPLVGAAIIAGTTNTVSYVNLGEPSKKITSIVTFKIKEQSPVFFKTNFTAKLYLKIETLATVSPASTVQTSFKTLTVNYDTGTGAKFNVRAYIAFKGVEQVKITIDTLNITGNNGWDPTASLQVENELRVLRYPILSNAAATLTPQNFTATATADAELISWTWNATANNNLSQLEWAYLPDELAGYYANTDLIFQNNSTRVDLGPGVGNYKIPLLYGDTGKLFYRLRPALRKNDGSVITGPWSATQNISYLGHQNNLNWQSSTSFAEEGKLKTVIQYFDGSMRSRQTVTKDNSTGNTIVAETIYDLQGRPNVQILPTPSIEDNIHYFKDFNRFAGQQQITLPGGQIQYEDPAKYFDLSLNATKCNGSPALDSTTGTGKYYSTLNAWLGGSAGEEKSKFVPNAAGYAYTETRFLDDVTQRVSSQGGVGAAFQINQGHDTKYFYGKPGQQELDALFGTEVGDGSHYSKNMVQDANGQMSISYTDMHGRTIATSLAGDSTANLSAIYTNTNYYAATKDVSLTNQLLTASNNIVSGNSIESISSLLAPATTSYNFTYQLDPAAFTLLNCNNQQICFDCKYDLEISIRAEDCSNSTAVVKRYNNLQLAPCGNSMGFIGEDITVPTKTISFPQTLTAGSWIVRKTLSLNDSMYLIRKDSVLKALLCRTEQNLYDSLYNVLIKITGCNTPGYNTTNACESCTANLGTMDAYRTKYLASIGADITVTNYDADIRSQYAKDSLNCSTACGALDINLSTLKVLRNQLLSDMMPYTGQYALNKDSIKNEAGVADPKRLENKFNIFTNSYTTNPGGVVTGKPLFYRLPKNENGAVSDYFTEDNQVDLSIEPMGSKDNSLLANITPDEYTNLFQPSWARSLLVYHPEFKKLQFAETNLSSAYAWLDKVQACTSYDIAFTQNYINPLSSDPYFVSNSTDKNTMSQYLTGQIGSSGFSIWQLANSNVSCAAQPFDSRLDCINKCKKDGIDGNLNKDTVWEQFKSIYLSYRNEMVAAYIDGLSGPGYLTPAEMDSLQRQGKTLVFASMARQARQNNANWWQIATTVPVDTAALAAAVAIYTKPYSGDQCEAQRPLWKARLLQCEQLQNWLLKATAQDTAAVNTTLKVILDSMVMVCHNSATAGQPIGNSTVNPVFTGLPQGFEDIINHVFKQRGIASTGDSNYFCNPYTIDFPKPFGKNPPLMVNKTNAIDSCGCKRFAFLKTEAKLAGYDTLNLGGTLGFNQFLMLNYKDSLTTTIWTGLQKCSAGLYKNSCTSGAPAAATQTGTAYPASGCPSNPVIIGVKYLNSTNSNNVQVNYTSNSSSTNCQLLIINLTTLVQKFQPITCGSNSITLSLLACQGYSFQIWIGCPQCRTTTAPASNCTDGTSNTYTLPACAQVCKTVYTPIFLPNFVVMPAFLNCGYQKPCISCNALNALVAEFKTIYPGYAVPNTSINATTPQLKENALLARFINFRTGFSKNAIEYLAAISTCAAGGTVPVICDYRKPLNDASDYISEALPCGDAQTLALYEAQILFQQLKDSLKANFEYLYQSKCLGAKYIEQFYATYQPKEYHYTLYYYDQAGNLVKTLPPAAVKPNYSSNFLTSVAALRQSAGDLNNSQNNELLGTNYRYNGLNQVVAQKTPDAGISKFWYDRLGRLVVSQNAKQLLAGAYSYTLYDALGRIQEVGQKPQTLAMTQGISQDTTSLSSWIKGGGVKEQLTYTKYDEADTDIAVSNAAGAGLWQINLRNRVSYTYVKATDNNDPNYPWDAASFYSYDIHGNVDTLYQDYKTGLGLINCNGEPSGNRFKKIVYCYDLISGKVNDVAYQPGGADQFYHHYNYDAENRLTEVKTSRDKMFWESEATYDYYRHGPLSRTVLGANKVQGLDYAYTLQGWLKGVNATSTGFDMGRDGIAASANQNVLVSRDAFGFSLNYYAGDYQPVSTSVALFVPITNTTQLFNGNIGGMLVNIPKLGMPNLYGYKYDQLNRLVKMDAFTGLNPISNNFPSAPIKIEDYHEEITYDPNGNIQSYLRNGDSRSLAMDKLGYTYVPNTNQLNYVSDAVTATMPADYNDIKNQSPNNYSYDAIGNLISDNQEGISKIDWTVYGKIQKITKTNGTIIRYGYDPSGNRISKIVNGDSTYYVRDASGNVMSVYNKKSAYNLVQKELPIYGSSRLGVYNVAVDVQNCPYVVPAAITIFTRGNKFFELANHLGNVLATVTDKKVQHSSDGTMVDYYTAEVNNATDYYPFGMQLPGRKGYITGSGTYTPSTTTTIPGTVVTDLVVTNRSNNTPPLYEATNSITFDVNFASTTGDIFEAHILEATTYYGGGGNGGGVWSSGVGGDGYRYGFNGKENDNEIKGDGNQQDYGLRIYDPRLGRFLSEDPITKSYPMLSPYQFASNRPIDGIDMDGLEYLTYTMSISKQTGAVFLKKVDWFNPKQHNAHGPLGQGVKYNVSIYDQTSNLKTNVNYSFVGRNANANILFVGPVYTEYGNYMGATSLFQVDNKAKFSKEYDYSLEAVDAVDNFAKLHDKGYDKLKAVGSSGLFNDWGTTPVDEAALNGWNNFLDKSAVGTVDPYNGQKVTKEERGAAWKGGKLFSHVVSSKKMGIANFIEKHFGETWQSGKGEKRTDHYYKVFLDKYLKKDADGNWIRKEEMWNRNKEGDYTTPKAK